MEPSVQSKTRLKNSVKQGWRSREGGLLGENDWGWQAVAEHIEGKRSKKEKWSGKMWSQCKKQISMNHVVCACVRTGCKAQMRQEQKGGKKQRNKASGKRRGWAIWRRPTQKKCWVIFFFYLFLFARLRCVFFRAVLKGQRGFVGTDFQWLDLRRPVLCPHSPWWTRSSLYLSCRCLYKDYDVENSASAWKGSAREWALLHCRSGTKKLQKRGFENYC